MSITSTAGFYEDPQVLLHRDVSEPSPSAAALPGDFLEIFEIESTFQWIKSNNYARVRRLMLWETRKMEIRFSFRSTAAFLARFDKIGFYLYNIDDSHGQGVPICDLGRSGIERRLWS
jgi:hypothetical protein